MFSTAVSNNPLHAALPTGIDPIADPADPALIRAVGAGLCLQLGILPWRRGGGATVVLCSDPARLASNTTHHADSLAPLGRIRHLPCTEEQVISGLEAAAASLLAAEAQDRVRAEHSCRRLTPAPIPDPSMGLAGRKKGLHPGFWQGAGLIALLVLALPRFVGLVLLAYSVLMLLAMTLLRLAALGAGLAAPPRPHPDDRDDRLRRPAGRAHDRLPVITLLVPILGESAIVPQLLARLGRIDYPAERLDLCLLTEEEDHATRASLEGHDLPGHVRVLTVPRGRIRTKPRALNYGLGFARGSIIGIYDAEDRPDPGQLLAVAAAFARSPPEVACLQAALDYYNPGHNWIARCFTLEYASWFRVVLPGVARLGLVVPLGGTSLFLRRRVIEELGGWDAYNVTEDADLGIRLARHGYRTRLIASTTEEEANARARPWIRQRSRWIKGYALTWAIHMYDPAALWRDLGPWRFAGLQAQFLGTVSLFLLAPVFWLFWLMFFGFADAFGPITTALAPCLIGLFVTSEAINLAAAALGARRAGKPRLIWAWPLGFLYYPMATLAAVRAMIGIIRDPFHWDKTAHGAFGGIAPNLARAENHPCP